MISAAFAVNPSFARSRIHGDYHLGQVLIGRDDVFIVDFEGEPLRSLHERRQKHSPLRDVAGMLRSIAYAAAATRKKARRAMSLDLSREWITRMSNVFLASYRQAIEQCPSYPCDAGAADRLLDLFLLEKALYEVRYELANRPDWADIPLAGVLDLLKR